MDISYKFHNILLVKYDGFVLVSSLLTAGVGVLAIAIIILIVWNLKLTKKLNERNTPEDFKIRRPRLITTTEQQSNRASDEPHTNFPYPNPLQFRNKNEKSDLFNVPSTSKGIGNRFGSPQSPNGYQSPPNHFDRNDRFY